MDEDFVKALELLAEARLLKLELSSASIECAVRTCAASDQWERALGLFEGLLQRGATPSTATTVAVLEAVGAEKNEELTDRALALVSGPGSSRQGDVEVSNVTARVLAQSGRALAAYDLVEAMVTKQQFVQVSYARPGATFARGQGSLRFVDGPRLLPAGADVLRAGAAAEQDWGV